MGIKYQRIAIDDKDFRYFKKECREMLRKYNPELDGVYITDRMMFRRMRKVYLKQL